DPEMEKTYEGPESGVGAKYMWSGNDSVGVGSLEILESVPGEYIKSTLSFTSPWESTSTIEWAFEETDGGVKTTWAVNGELPGYLFWMGQEDMDAAMGKDFEEGLMSLKELAEAGASQSSDMTVTMVEVEALPIYYIEGESTLDGIDSTFYAERYGKIGAYLGADMENMLEMPLAVAKMWDEENDKAVIQVAIACESDKEGEGEIMKGMTHAGKAAKCEFTGPYEQTGAAHEAIFEYITANNMEIIGSPWEIYVTDPGTEPDPNKWVTAVYYPVQ
ncbi:MAG: GyrI-like domain-containing protein, partial [Bacteroidota bacterium]